MKTITTKKRVQYKKNGRHSVKNKWSRKSDKKVKVAQFEVKSHTNSSIRTRGLNQTICSRWSKLYSPDEMTNKFGGSIVTSNQT